MAAAMTSEELGERFHVESVGIDVGQKSASLEAIKVMQEHGLDINDHCPRDISSVNLNEYDFVIAMTSFIANQLKDKGIGETVKLVVWEVADPYGKGLDRYRECAQSIKHNIAQFAMAAETRKALRSTARSAVFQDRSTELSPQLTNLKDYIHNAISRLKDGSLVGSHLLGVGSKSIGLFDHALREILKFYIRMAAVSYEQQLKNIVKSKSIDELTLGEVIVCLRTLDKEITRICRLKPSTIGDNRMGGVCLRHK